MNLFILCHQVLNMSYYFKPAALQENVNVGNPDGEQSVEVFDFLTKEIKYLHYCLILK